MSTPGKDQNSVVPLKKKTFTGFQTNPKFVVTWHPLILQHPYIKSLA